jgi:2-polyprenyl-3-methyl-5-hydroxy-6-metoxy-1,4-benzoquinol methylase
MECHLCNHTEFDDLMAYRAVSNDVIFQNSRLVKCKRCGLNQINRTFTQAALTDYYQNQYDRDSIYQVSPDNFPKDNLFSVSRGRALAKLYQKLALPTPKTVCDLGCGYGHLLYGFSQFFPQAHYTGVEYDPNTEAILKRLNFDFRLGGIDDIDELQEKVDVLITSHVFEHVVDPNQFVDQCKNLLSPQGVFVWEMPNSDPFNLSCERRHSPHICLWDIDTLRKVLENHGLTVLFLDTAGKKYSFVDSLEKGIIKTAGLFIQNMFQKETNDISLSDKDAIGFKLDLYGNNRRNLRVIARKSDK